MNQWYVKKNNSEAGVYEMKDIWQKHTREILKYI